MNQIACPICKHRVNHTAHCSDCGAQLPPPNPGAWARLSTGQKIAVVFIGIVVIGAIARLNDDGKQSASTPSRPASSASKTWHTIREFTGKGIKQTETFTVTGDEWRISWDTSPGQYGDMNFQIYVYKSDGSLENVAANVIGADKDSTILRGSGSYYLSINTAQPYKIKIEDNY